MAADSTMPAGPRVAYFSMEMALEPSIPTYSGGLGVLSGDTLRAAADRGLQMVGVTLLHRKGYFTQVLDGQGRQSEQSARWKPEERLERLRARATVRIGPRDVRIRAWRYSVEGVLGHVVPVYLLDASLRENHPDDRGLTDHLYGGDWSYRLSQEILLGRGGIAMLRALGHERFDSYHMNEGHSALLALALLEEELEGGGGDRTEAVESVRRQCVFTTHTPVPAGHDTFPGRESVEMLGPSAGPLLESLGCMADAKLNMTSLALFFSRYVNGVSMRHEAVSRDMFPGYPINAITNGVHGATWAAPSIRDLLDRRIPEWRRDNLYLRYALGIPEQEIQAAHSEAKAGLLDEVERRTGRRLDVRTFTIGFARRATLYKRPGLVFSDLERLRSISRKAGPIQLIFAGKAHPHDEPGKGLIREVHRAAEELKGDVEVVWVGDYDMTLGLALCSGVDLWLNTPRKPEEASGTSGMKAALNGVPSLSVLDGWWLEGHVEGITGWSVGDSPEPVSNDAGEAASLYAKLEYIILPMYYRRPVEYARVRRAAIALNASFFNAQRMITQYILNAYRHDHRGNTP